MELCEQLKELYLSMSIMGFVTNLEDSPDRTSSMSNEGSEDNGDDSPGGDTFETRGTRGERTCFRNFGNCMRRLYCCGVCCFLWLRLLTYVPCFWVGLEYKPDLFAPRITTTIWLAHCALNVTVFLYGSFRKNHLTNFRVLWNSLSPEYRSRLKQANDGDASVCYADVSATKWFKKVKANKKSGKLAKSLEKEVAGKEGKMSEITDAIKALSESETVLKITNISRKPDRLEIQGHVVMPFVGFRKEYMETSPISGSVEESTSSLSMAFFDSDSRTGSVRCAWEQSDSSLNEKAHTEDKVDAERDKEAREYARHYESRMRTIGRKYAIAAWIVTIASVSLTSSLLFLDSVIPEVTPVQTILLNPFGSSLPVRIGFVFVLFVNTCAWILPPTFCCALCSILCVRFNVFSDVVRDGMARCGGEFPPEMELWRHEHLRLCQSVTVLDRTMRLMVMSAYTTCLPLCIFLLYSVATETESPVSTTTKCFWLFVNFCTIFIISVHAAAVHEAAHSPLDSLFFVRADKADTSQLAQLQLFLSKLTGSSIGFTVLGIITVTKEMILTLGGLLVTYFLVLLDYRDK